MFINPGYFLINNLKGKQIQHTVYVKLIKSLFFLHFRGRYIPVLFQFSPPGTGNDYKPETRKSPAMTWQIRLLQKEMKKDFRSGVKVSQFYIS